MNQINFNWFLSISGITWVLAIICFCVGQFTMGKIFLIPTIVSFVVRVWISLDLFQYEINRIKFENIYHFLNAPLINIKL